MLPGRVRQRCHQYRLHPLDDIGECLLTDADANLTQPPHAAVLARAMQRCIRSSAQKRFTAVGRDARKTPISVSMATSRCALGNPAWAHALNATP